MQRGLRGFVHSLSLRLLLRVLGTIAVVFAAYAFLSYRATSSRWTDTMNDYAARTGDLIKRATKYSMMLNREEDLHHTVRLLAESPNIRGIRVYDKSGSIIFSADASEVGRKVDLQAEACVICHDQAEPLRSVPSKNRMRVYRAASGERILGVINPIENEAQCSSAACHAHPKEQSVLGVLDVQVSMDSVDQALESTQGHVLWLTLVMLAVVGMGTVGFVYRIVRRPIFKLHEGTQRVAHGDLDYRIEVETQDEVGRLAVAFNRMTEDLQHAYRELTGWSHKLEDEVEAKTAELGRIQRQIVHMEKMASLGKLSATVAHEINNPLAGILTYSKLVSRSLGDESCSQEDKEEMQRWLGLIQKESSRCGDIVKNLLLFARQSGARFAPVHVREVLERSLMLVGHHLEIAGVELEHPDFEGDDEILGDGDQVQQALIALLVNAVEAMHGGEGGRLTVRGRGAEDGIHLEIGDTGGGIPEEVLPHIFEPFFSTKNKESGVGLGLAVVYGIVQRHGGTIDVDTELGRGTTFRLFFPRRPSEGASGQHAAGPSAA